MKRSLVTTSILWALPIGLAAAATAPFLGELYFQPSDGVTLRHSLEVQISYDLDDFEMQAMGQTVGAEESGLDPSEMTGEADFAFDATEAIESAERGRTLSMVRTYGEMTINGETEDTAEGPNQVRFTWNEDSNSHDVEVLDEDADEEDQEIASAMLSEDMGLRMVLPDGEVEEGDTWTVTAGAEGVLAMFFPGVRLDGAAEFAARMAAEEEPEAEAIVLEAAEMLFGAFEDAAIDFTYAGMVEDGEQQVAQLDMATEFTASFDPTEMVQRAAATAGEATPEFEGTVEVLLSGAAEGTVFWNVEANRLHRMELEGDWTFDVNADLAIIMEGLGEVPMEGIVSFSGTFASAHDVTEE